MLTSDAVIEKILTAFAGNEHPGARFLQGSFEGCEPYDEVGPFEKLDDWRGIEAGFLDGHASALSFFSEAGFRFFLPAYLISDLRGRRPVFQAAIIVFLIGSVICGFAGEIADALNISGINAMIAGRAVQGLGGGGLM